MTHFDLASVKTNTGAKSKPPVKAKTTSVQVKPGSKPRGRPPTGRIDTRKMLAVRVRPVVIEKLDQFIEQEVPNFQRGDVITVLIDALENPKVAATVRNSLRQLIGNNN